MKPTQEQVIAWARDTGCLNVADYGHKSYEFQPEELERFVTLAYEAGRKDENEACALIAETPITGEQDDITMQAKDRIAAAIRARREQ